PGKVQLGISPLPGLLAEELLRRLPSSLGRVLFTSSGAEAVEAAIKLGRAATGRSKVVSCEHGFHGLTLGALSAAGDDAFTSAFGRTGRMFALDHWGLEPDLVTVAKSLSGGYVPVGALVMSTAVYDAVFDTLEHAVSHGSTFAPNDLAMAAGLATLEELDAQRLPERAARMGELLLERTRPLVERYEIVKEVRGLGLIWAIEFQEPAGGSRSWRLLERMQTGLFAQLVVVPLFDEHKILTQVAGHDSTVI